MRVGDIVVTEPRIVLGLGHGVRMGSGALTPEKEMGATLFYPQGGQAAGATDG